MTSYRDIKRRNLSIYCYQGLNLRSVLMIWMMISFLPYMSAQVDSSANRPFHEIPAARLSMDELVCVSGGYFFRVNGFIYKHKETLVQCASAFPITVTLIDENFDDVEDDVSWTNATVTEENSNSAIINIENFGSDKKITVQAHINDQDVDLKVKKDAKLEFESIGSTQRNFDENEINGYPSYNTIPPGLPWKYLVPYELDNIQAKISSSKAQNSIEWMYPDDNLLILPSDPPSDEFTMSLIYSPEPASHAEIDVRGCAEETELKVFVASEKHLTIDVVYVCDSRNNNCPNTLDIVQRMEDLNNIFNKAGVEFTYGQSFTDEVEYESNGTFDQMQFNQIHSKYVRFQASNADIVVMIVNDAGNDKNGNPRSGYTYFGEGAVAIDHKKIKESTIAHEIGHTEFLLYHPGRSMGFSTGGSTPKSFPAVTDKNNLMFYDVGARRDNKIRQYQLNKIH